MKQLMLPQLFALALWIARPSYGAADGLNKRLVDISKVSDFRGALLLIDGKQTTCEIALSDNRAGYVAASCIGLNGDKVDYSLKYEVYIYNGRNTDSSKYHVDSITVHPAYNQTSYANNIAVIQFNKAERTLWKNYIGKYPYEWTNHFYVRRTLTSSQEMKWADPIVIAEFKDNEGCLDASGLYKNNRGGLYCIDSSVLSNNGKNCQRPYTSMYAVIDPNDLGIAALYSHSAVYGKDMCGNNKIFHYYTILTNYNMWAASVIGYDISIFTHTSDTSTQPKTFAMNSTTTQDDPRISLFAGNLYGRDSVIPSSTTSSLTVGPTGTSGASNPSASSSNSSHGSSSDKSSSGIPHSAIIAIAVAVPVGTIFGVVVLFFVYKWWRKRQNELRWNANDERSHYNALQIANELGGARGRDSMLPPYEANPPGASPPDARPKSTIDTKPS
ncbi:hypothetical protein GGI12_001837 [Dipsacomyces acuminosporus]|nr:hypothetical protein GGI12_001837 [Dipsacomyces acuminosporus]